jgi:type VI secretion system protein VasJ
MLGSVRGDSEKWMWSAFGKHPVAKDYFFIGSNSPIIKAFSDWVENGYRHLISNVQGEQSPCSWRFWVKGGGKDTLSCGLLKDSSDRVGRRYPFLMMGTGVIKGRHHHWHLLPITFDQTWSQMEFLSTRRFSTFQELEDAVLEGRAPSADWPEIESHVEHVTDLSQVDLEEELFTEKEHVVIPLKISGARSSLEAVYTVTHFLKERFQEPNAVFIGGTSQESYLSFYNRAMGPDDFSIIWNLGKSNGTSFA